MKKASRSDLLGALTALQGLIGKAMAANNDRNPHRYAHTMDYLQRAHELCIEARSDDPPGAGSRSCFARRDEITPSI